MEWRLSWDLALCWGGWWWFERTGRKGMATFLHEVQGELPEMSLNTGQPSQCKSLPSAFAPLIGGPYCVSGPCQSLCSHLVSLFPDWLAETKPCAMRNGAHIGCSCTAPSQTTGFKRFLFGVQYPSSDTLYCTKAPQPRQPAPHVSR